MSTARNTVIALVLVLAIPTFAQAASPKSANPGVDAKPLMTLSADDLFVAGSSQLSEDAFSTLWPLARHLAEDVKGPVVVAVHSSPLGSAARNQALSQRRAARLRMALVGMGVEAGRIAAVGYGESHSTRQGVELWRRAELTR